MAQAAVQRQKEDLVRFFECATDLFSVTSLDGYFKLLNPAWEVVLGHTIEQLQSQPFLTFVHPDDVEATWAEIERVATERISSFTFENRYRTSYGSYRWLQWNPVDTESGLVYAIARDITQRKEAEAKLRESQA